MLGFWMWVCLGTTCIWFISICHVYPSEVSDPKSLIEKVQTNTYWHIAPSLATGATKYKKLSLHWASTNPRLLITQSIRLHISEMTDFVFSFFLWDFFPKLREWNYNFILNGSRLYWHIFSLLLEIWSQVRQFSKRVWYLQHCIKPSGSSSGL